MDNSSYLNKKIEDSQDNSKAVINFEFEEFDEYTFPYEDEIPEGCYCSMIMNISYLRKRQGDEFYDVCYKIFSSSEFNSYNNGYIDKISYNYIRQRYKKGSEPYRKFIKAMSVLTGTNKFCAEDLIGCIENIRVAYKRKGSMASIVEREPSKLTEEWFSDDLIEENDIDYSEEDTE